MGIKDNLKRGTFEMILLHLLEQEDVSNTLSVEEKRIP